MRCKHWVMFAAQIKSVPKSSHTISSLYLIYITLGQRVHLYNQVQSVSFLYSPYVHPISSQYSVSPAPLQTVLTSTAHAQSEIHIYSPCPDSTPSLLPMSTLGPIFTSHIYPASTQYLKPISSWHPISTLTVQSEYHLYCPCMFDHNTSSPAHSSQPTICFPHVQSVHNLTYSNPVSISYFLPICSQNTTSTVHVQSEYHHSCLWSNSTQSIPPMSCHNTTSQFYFQLVHHLPCRCPVSTQPPLPKPSQ